MFREKRLGTGSVIAVFYAEKTEIQDGVLKGTGKWTHKDTSTSMSTSVSTS